MPEQAQEGVVTNTGQPLVAVGQPATEMEVAMAGKATPIATQTATGTPAVE